MPEAGAAQNEIPCAVRRALDARLRGHDDDEVIDALLPARSYQVALTGYRLSATD
jgi:hypothetical protein